MIIEVHTLTSSEASAYNHDTWQHIVSKTCTRCPIPAVLVRFVPTREVSKPMDVSRKDTRLIKLDHTESKRAG